MKIKLKFIAIPVFMFCLSLNALAQDYKKGEEILKKVAEKTNGYETIDVKFSLEQESMQTEESFTEKGRMILKDNKYKILLEGTEIYYNGKTMWTHLVDAEEVNVSEPKQDKQALSITNPRRILNIYNEDFKCNYIDDITLDNKVYRKVDLYPKDLDENFSRIRVLVDKETFNLYMTKVFYKDGNRFTLKLNEFNTNKRFPDSIFSFDQTAHPDVEVIDMRF